jgi:hypothetical protein
MDPAFPTQANGQPLRQAAGAALFGLLLLCAAGAGRAESQAPHSPGLKFSANGFYTLGLAKAVRVRPGQTGYGLRCDCFVTEYSQGGVVEDGRVGFLADSKLGLQAAVSTADGRWSLTGQLVARGARDGKVNLEWLYATYQISGNWTAQFGRKRLPLLAYSEVQDVGVAISWVRPPTQLYGWDIVNYNGANLQWRGTWGPVAVLANAYAGSETLKDSPYEALYYTDGTRTDSRWGGIRGIELAAQWGALKLRAASVQANSSYLLSAPGEAPAFYPGGKLRMSTLSASFEPGAWIFGAEAVYGDRRSEFWVDKSRGVQAGRRFGELTLLLGHMVYRQVTTDPAAAAQSDDMTSVVLRWDSAPGRVWKLQFDDFRDKSSGGFSVGSRRLVSISHSGVF